MNADSKKTDWSRPLWRITTRITRKSASQIFLSCLKRQNSEGHFSWITQITFYPVSWRHLQGFRCKILSESFFVMCLPTGACFFFQEKMLLCASGIVLDCLCWLSKIKFEFRMCPDAMRMTLGLRRDLSTWLRQQEVSEIARCTQKENQTTHDAVASFLPFLNDRRSQPCPPPNESGIKASGLSLLSFSRMRKNNDVQAWTGPQPHSSILPIIQKIFSMVHEHSESHQLPPLCLPSHCLLPFVTPLLSWVEAHREQQK